MSNELTDRDIDSAVSRAVDNERYERERECAIAANPKQTSSVPVGKNGWPVSGGQGRSASSLIDTGTITAWLIVLFALALAGWAVFGGR